MCVSVCLCACSVSGSDGMDLSGQQTHAAGRKYTKGTHAALLSWACITAEECFQREFCVLTGLHEMARSTQAASHIHTDSLLPSLNLLASHYKAHPVREEGFAGWIQSPECHTNSSSVWILRRSGYTSPPKKIRPWQQGDPGQRNN